MKKYKIRQLIFVIATACIFSGCSASSPKTGSGIESYVSDFYRADYDYIKTTETEQEDGTVSRVVYEGELTNDPYMEHIRITSDPPQSLTEIYRTEKLGTVTSKLLYNGEWIEQKGLRERPSGYGEKITYQFNRTEQIDGKEIDIYDAFYTVDAARGYGLKEELTAKVSQEYYFDTQEGHIVKVVTDFSDLNRAVQIANMMSVNHMAREEAEAAGGSDGINVKETLELFNYSEKQ